MLGITKQGTATQNVMCQHCDRPHTLKISCFSSCNLPFCGLIGNISVTFVENGLLNTPIYFVIEAQIHTNSYITAMSDNRHVVSNHWSTNCLFNIWFRQTTQKHQGSVLPSLCEGNPPMTGGFLPQGDSNAKYVFIWWYYNVVSHSLYTRGLMA